MTSTITNYSALIDTTYPVPGVDNDTQGFRDNYIQIKRGLESAASEITELQITQNNLNTKLNNATLVGDNYATLIANTVTSLVLNSVNNELSEMPMFAAQNPPITSDRGSVGDRPGMFWADENYIYVCIGSYDSTSSIWVRAATTSSW